MQSLTGFDRPISIPANRAECLATLRSSWQGPALNEAAIKLALERPCWPGGLGPSMFDLVRPGQSVGLVVSDHTRKTATDRLLPILLQGWLERHCRLEDFFILVASGIHRPPNSAEIARILGADLAKAFAQRLWIHDPDDAANLVEVGQTQCGHPVCVNRRALRADRLILLGAANYHYHAGFGGGRKALVPGLSARATIAFNHSLTLDPQRDQIHPAAVPGRLDGNPVAEEMLAGARLCRPSGIINTVLAPDGSLAGVFAGDLDLAHRAACRLVEQINRINLVQAADFVIASAQPATNWIQSHKALFNAFRAIVPAGRVILSAPCPEGLGDERFRYWVRQPSLHDIFKGLRQSPEVLGQTALSTRMRAPQTILVTDLNARDRRDLSIPTAPDLDIALAMVLERARRLGKARPTYYLMPEALSLVPFLKQV